MNRSDTASLSEMVLFNDSNETDVDNLTCRENIDVVTSELDTYQTLSLLVPTDDNVWTERDQTWMVLFSIIISVFALVYFCIGLTAVVLMVRKNCLRIPTKTFFAVYLCMIILGFSRSVLFILDPFGILGFIRELFPAWIIISRFLASVGFPSLVGACTLIILTLVKLAKTSVGKQWYEHWSYVLLLTAIPYAIAITAESLGYITHFAALLSGLICETFFVLWGVSICIFYLLAGKHLLNKIVKRQRRATKLTESNSTTSAVIQSANAESAAYFAKHYSKAQRIKRKIIIITFGTAIAGIFYAVVSAGGVIMVLLLIFYDCMGLFHKTNAVAWLAVQFLNYVAEILLSIFILYSMTDVSKFVEFLKFAVSCCCFCCFTEEPMSMGDDSEGRDPGHNVPEGQNAQLQDCRKLGDEEEETERLQTFQNPSETEVTPTHNGSELKRCFQIDLHDPDGSLESSESPSMADQTNTERLKQERKTSVAHLQRTVSETLPVAEQTAEQRRKITSMAQLPSELQSLQANDHANQKQKRGKKVSLAQLQSSAYYNSIEERTPEEESLDAVGKILSISESPTVKRSFQGPMKFFRRTPNQSRETTPTDGLERKLEQLHQMRKLRHFPSSPSPASPQVKDVCSSTFLSSSNLSKSYLEQQTTSPITPPSPYNSSSGQKQPSETQRLLEKQESASKLSRKGTI